jgi:acetate kinase
VDNDKNKTARGNVAEIQKDGAPVRILVVRTNEEFEIAQQTMRAIEKCKEH